MNKKFLVVLVLLLIAGFLVNSYLLTAKNKQTTDTSATEEQADKLTATDEQQIAPAEDKTADDSVAEDKMTQAYTLADVSAHASPEDCWLAIDGKVYDVTGYIEKGIHPGGEAILFGCGKDATEIFKNRPNGSGSHSEKAFGFLENFYIGDLN
ncbi:MAG: cytochrome b5 domain-containing protein [Candidatus Pacebacteria bacterium]|nr:cytochrome b5 domain-containing protein [Candidatus Paceibacterota bacterium]